jgi:tRNA(Ile2) C34 agmatinyltransferase TiaS
MRVLPTEKRRSSINALGISRTCRQKSRNRFVRQNGSTRTVSLDNLVVHHVDQQGRGKTQVNNALENLQTLCRACHMAAHRSREWIEKRRPVKPSGRWSRRHDVCRDCGTTTRHHGAHGFCRTCYARLQRGPLPIEDMVRAFEKSKEADRNRVSRNKKATK